MLQVASNQDLFYCLLFPLMICVYVLHLSFPFPFILSSCNAVLLSFSLWQKTYISRQLHLVAKRRKMS